MEAFQTPEYSKTMIAITTMWSLGDTSQAEIGLIIPDYQDPFSKVNYQTR